MNIVCVLLAAAGFVADWSVGPVAEPKGEVDVANCIAEPSAWTEKKAGVAYDPDGSVELIPICTP
jgi:hypothetical protein